MSITRAREIMRDWGIKYARSYKVKYRIDYWEVVFYSSKTNRKCVVCDREDIGGFTGASLR